MQSVKRETIAKHGVVRFQGMLRDPLKVLKNFSAAQFLNKRALKRVAEAARAFGDSDWYVPKLLASSATRKRLGIGTALTESTRNALW